MVRFAFQNGAFCVLKWCVLRSKMVRFAKRPAEGILYGLCAAESASVMEGNGRLQGAVYSPWQHHAALCHARGGACQHQCCDQNAVCQLCCHVLFQNICSSMIFSVLSI